MTTRKEAFQILANAVGGDRRSVRKAVEYLQGNDAALKVPQVHRLVEALGGEQRAKTLAGVLNAPTPRH